MSSNPICGLCQLGCANGLLGVMFCISSSPVVAQIVPDTTLPTNSVVTSNGNIFTIDGGTTAGSNLFHSFSAFSLPSGTAQFNNATDITNIISRVTGTSISNIDGTLQANGSANLFLINPNGIIFGPNASLNIGGSFIGSTANGIQFADGTVFSTTNPSTPPLLTVSVPLGVQYGGNPGSIQVQGSTLQVNPGQSLALVGGDVSMDGGKLVAAGGRVELGGVAPNETVGLSFDGTGNIVRLNFPVEVQRADISITNGTNVDVTAEGGGSIALNARNIALSEKVFLTAGISENSGSVGAVAGDVNIDATGIVTFKETSLIQNQVNKGATGNAGNINVVAGSLYLINGSQLFTSTFGNGNSGSVNINVREQISFEGVNENGAASGAFSSVGEGGIGNGGSINIETGSLAVKGGAGLFASTFGEGDAGSVNINAHERVSFEGVNSNGGASGAFSSVGEGAVGNGIGINIKTGSLSLTAGAGLFVVTEGKGNAGDIVIDADSIDLSGVSEFGFSSGMFANTNETGKGQGGNIIVKADVLQVRDGAVLSARTLNAQSGGNISVDANTLELANGGQLLTSAYSSGQAGNIIVNSSGRITLSGSDPTFAERQAKFGSQSVSPASSASGLFANTDTNSTAQGGDISITTGELQVLDTAQVSVNSQGSGNAGVLKVVASDSIHIEDQSTISADTSGGGGNINLTSPLILLRRDGDISTNARGTDITGGNITINTTNLVAIPKEDSDITANSKDSRGGTVTVNASGGIFGLKFRDQDYPNSSDITASGGNPALSGTVTINGPEVDPAQGVANLPETLADASNQIVTTCQAAAEGNSFTVTGRGGLPEDPTGTIRGQTVWRDFQDFSQGTGVVQQTSSQNPQALMASRKPRLVEANSWKYDEKGNVVLVAVERNGTPSNYNSKPPQCQDLSSVSTPKN